MIQVLISFVLFCMRLCNLICKTRVDVKTQQATRIEYSGATSTYEEVIKGIATVGKNEFLWHDTFYFSLYIFLILVHLMLTLIRVESFWLFHVHLPPSSSSSSRKAIFTSICCNYKSKCAIDVKIMSSESFLEIGETVLFE